MTFAATLIFIFAVAIFVITVAIFMVFVATIAATFTIATTVAITVVPTATTTAIFVKAFLFEGNGRSGVIFTGTASAGSFATVFNNNAAKSVAEYFSNNASADSRYLSKPFSSRSLSMVSTAALNCPLNASFRLVDVMVSSVFR